MIFFDRRIIIETKNKSMLQSETCKIKILISLPTFLFPFFTECKGALDCGKEASESKPVPQLILE